MHITNLIIFFLGKINFRKNLVFFPNLISDKIPRWIILQSSWETSFCMCYSGNPSQIEHTWIDILSVLLNKLWRNHKRFFWVISEVFFGTKMETGCIFRSYSCKNLTISIWKKKVEFLLRFPQKTILTNPVVDIQQTFLAFWSHQTISQAISIRLIHKSHESFC